MSLRNTVLKGVNTAFRVCDSLAVDVTFNLASATGYNFATGSAETSSSGALTVRGIVFEDNRAITDGNGVSTKLLVKKSDITGDINTYASFTVNSKEYALDNYTDYDYIIELEMRGA